MRWTAQELVAVAAARGARVLWGWGYEREGAPLLALAANDQLARGRNGTWTVRQEMGAIGRGGGNAGERAVKAHKALSPGDRQYPVFEDSRIMSLLCSQCEYVPYDGSRQITPI